MKLQRIFSFLLCLFLFVPTASATEIPEVPNAAFQVSADVLCTGDQVLLYNPGSDRIIGRFLCDTSPAPVYVSFSDSNSGAAAITDIPYDAAVFTVEINEEGSLSLRMGDQYLSARTDDGNVFFSDEKAPESLWEIVDGKYLRNKHATHNGMPGYLSFDKNFVFRAAGEDSEMSQYEFQFLRSAGNVIQAQTGYILPLVETSDIHGYLFDATSEPLTYFYAYIADKIFDLRGRGDEYDPSRSVLLDGGDIFVGNILFPVVGSTPMQSIYNYMDYDAVVIGNHEFDMSIEKIVDPDATLADFTVDGKQVIDETPVLACNLFVDGEPATFADEYVILEKTACNESGEALPVKIGVIGYLMDYSSGILPSFFSKRGFSIAEDPEYVNRLAFRLENELGCDATIVLAHASAETTAISLGAETPVDLVFGGHTHESLCGFTDWGLPYAQPSGNAASFTSAALSFEKNDQNQPVLQDVHSLQTHSVLQAGSLLTDAPGNEGALEKHILDLSSDALFSMQKLTGEKLGYITEDILLYSYLGEDDRSCTAGNWITGLLRRACDADVAFVNLTGLRAEFVIPEGKDQLDIHLGDVFSMFPFENNIYCYEITYGELLEIFRFSLAEQGEILFAHMSGIDCYYEDGTVLTLVMQGVPIYHEGVWLEGWKDKTLRLSVNSYTAHALKEGNPLLALNDTPQHISSDQKASSILINQLREEGLANDGYLFVDTEPHMILGHYPGTTEE